MDVRAQLVPVEIRVPQVLADTVVQMWWVLLVPAVSVVQRVTLGLLVQRVLGVLAVQLVPTVHRVVLARQASVVLLVTLV